MKKLIITIDGPAASGKEKIAKYISKKWKLNHLDSGILYRRLALIFLVENIDVSSIHKIESKLNFRKKSIILISIFSKRALNIKAATNPDVPPPAIIIFFTFIFNV